MTEDNTPIVQGLDAPARNAAAVTPSDEDEFSFFTRAIYVGGAGDLAVLTMGGQTVTFAAIPVGSLLPVRAKKVLATGTTATDIVRLW